MRLLPVLLGSLAGGLTLSVGPALAANRPPEVKLLLASHVSKTAATIEVEINPEGSETSYEILLEGLAAGQQRRQGVLPAGLEAQTVTDAVTGLQPGHLYKYAVIASNAAGREGYLGADFLTCPSEGVCPPQPAPGGESLWAVEGARRSAEEAPAREAERQARQREAEERPAKEAAERAAKEREIREAGERAGKEAAERAAAAASRALRCVVPRLRGDSLAVARQALHRAHCGLGPVTRPRRHHRRLVVVAQSARSGRALAVGTKVAVTLRAAHA